MLLFRKTFLDETEKAYSLEYFLLVGFDGAEPVYGAEIRLADEKGLVEADSFIGLSRKRETAEAFLRKLWEGSALPVELAALCDDFISERERLGEYAFAVAAS